MALLRWGAVLRQWRGGNASELIPAAAVASSSSSFCERCFGKQQERWFGAKGSKGSKDGGDEGSEDEGDDAGEKKKRYGKVGHNVAEESYKQRVKKKDEGDEESLEKTNFDISKRTRPSGDE